MCLGHVALVAEGFREAVGNKVQANASEHKVMTHERMLRAEMELQREINALLRKAQILDPQEDKRYGKGKRGSELPEELRHKQSRLERIRQARKLMNAKTSADQGIDVYIATGRLPHGKPAPPRRGPLPKDADEKTRMARKLRSKQGSAIYAQRKAIVEPVNGQIKEARGLRRFLLRGLEKVDAEWHLIAGTHNLLKLWRFRRSQQQGLVAAAA